MLKPLNDDDSDDGDIDLRPMEFVIEQEKVVLTKSIKK